MARDILSVPMSSVAFECAFNTGERLISAAANQKQLKHLFVHKIGCDLRTAQETLLKTLMKMKSKISKFLYLV